MNLTDKARELTEAVKKTREYIELKQAQSLLNKNPVLKKKVEEIIKKQQELMVNYKSGQEELKAKIMQLNEESSKIAQIPEVGNYLTAIRNFNNMMSNVFKTINNLIEYDLKNN